MEQNEDGETVNRETASSDRVELNVDAAMAREKAESSSSSQNEEVMKVSAESPYAREQEPEPEKDTEKGSMVKGLFRELVELVVVTLVLLIVIRWALGEARYIPSASMTPTLQINDRLIVEKVTKHLGQPIKRGDILVFYPPPSEMGGQDLKNDPLHILGRLTGLPYLPNDPAFIKRVIGLPGDHIRIQAGVGVFVNGMPLNESLYVKEPPMYDLNYLGDIRGRNVHGENIQPYADRASEPIIVPAGHLFMMGDNRNNSEDSHVWGFLDQKRVIGRAFVLIWRRLDPPIYPPTLDD